jgi:tripeptide aminopeptidase
MELTERFLDYVSFDTQSSETSDTTPSTPKQLVFAEHLRQQLDSLGFDDVYLDSHGYIYATLPANTSRPVPTIGFISHYDTSPDCSGADIKPRIIAGYDGGDILLSEKSGRTLSPAMFPELLQHKGEDLIVTDGTTLLGADDKAGIAEIVQAMVWLKQHPEVEHGTVRIAFNPDEEIGMGAHLFDVERFGCEWAYTMDGGEVGEIEYENFNAASARVKITGVSVHPGYAKGKMKNAARIAAELVGMIPDSETPETTQDYEGFYHLTGMEGNVESATVNYIIRDHDRAKFESRKKFFAQVVARLNAKYGSGTASVEISDSYYNMIEKIEPVIHIIDIVKKAMQEVGITPKVRAIRGGTDGAQLSFRGLPCPNIFAGGINFHGSYEFVPVQSMEKAMKTIVKICELTAQTGA